ncbi:MAG TPA: sulfite exporter TauE/SafE family protein [Candidatus Limnocylindria bacterium]|nr:sulfite exporter TauE/SafE family protein [Candidatus Limnocylindria bacterium]
MDNHPQIWVLAAGVFFGFLTQTVVAFAAGLVAFPFLLTQYTLPQAIAFMSPYYVVFSAVLIYKNRKDVDWQVWKELALGVCLGLIVGLVVLKYANPVWLEKFLGAFLVCYSLYEWRNKKNIFIPKRLFQFFGFLGGVMSGIFTSGSSVLGPLVRTRIKNGVIMRATFLAIFGITNFIRFPAMFFGSLITRDILIQSLIVSPVFVLAVICGHIIYKYINEKMLAQLVLIFFIASGVFLLLK